MTMHKLKEILEDYKNGDLDQEATLRLLSKLPYEDLEFARIDHHRGLRRGFPEVIYGATKSAPQIVDIIRAMRAWDADVLVTRVDESKATAIMAEIPEAGYHPPARALVLTGNAATARQWNDPGDLRGLVGRTDRRRSGTHRGADGQPRGTLL